MFENSVHLMGRLTRTPEVRTAGENKVCNFSVAVNRRVNGENVTDFIDCVAWGKSAELLGGYFAKGDRVGVDGSLRVRKYTDKEGNNRSSTEVLVESLAFIEKKGESAQGGAVEKQQKPVVQPVDDTVEDDDELPF